MSYQKSDISGCDELRQLLPEFAVGALNSDEVRRVKALLEECPDLREELVEYFALTAAFYERIEPVEPPKELHERLLAKVRATNGTRAYAETPKVDAAAQNEIDALRQQRQNLASYVSAHDLRRVLLVDSANVPVATLLWRPNKLSALLTSTNFSPIQTGAACRLWLISDERRHSAGIFNIDETGFVLFNVILSEPIDHYEEVVITLEQNSSDVAAPSPIAQGKI